MPPGGKVTDKQNSSAWFACFCMNLSHLTAIHCTKGWVIYLIFKSVSLFCFWIWIFWLFTILPKYIFLLPFLKVTFKVKLKFVFILKPSLFQRFLQKFFILSWLFQKMLEIMLQISNDGNSATFLNFGIYISMYPWHIIDFNFEWLFGSYRFNQNKPSGV